MWGRLSCEAPGFACYGIRLCHIEVEEAVEDEVAGVGGDVQDTLD